MQAFFSTLSLAEAGTIAAESACRPYFTLAQVFCVKLVTTWPMKPETSTPGYCSSRPARFVTSMLVRMVSIFSMYWVICSSFISGLTYGLSLTVSMRPKKLTIQL